MTKRHLDIVSENKKRKKALFSPYDPVRGIGSILQRKKFIYTARGMRYSANIPVAMFDNPVISMVNKHHSIERYLRYINERVDEMTIRAIEKLILDIRLDNDFEYWAFETVKIQDKESKKPIPFVLNKPQRRLLATLEEMRLEGDPIRIILLKARQWGGSTLIQMYMGWVQTRLKTSWHSAIVADVEEQSKNIRSMYSKMAKNYPEQFGSITFAPFEGSTKTRVIRERDCVVGVGSAQKPESLRSFDFAMLHLSEVGLWKSTPQRSAEDLIQSLQATVPDEPDTLICLESTAKGVGNFFHRTWVAAEKGESVYKPVFVPWFEIERYQKTCPSYEKFINSWHDYEWFLWELGATIEGIYWYVMTQTGYNYDEWRMRSEYPSTAAEAFQSSGRRAFHQKYVLKVRKSCRKPSFTGDVFAASQTGPEALKDIKFLPSPQGKLSVWEMPDVATTPKVANRYCAFADIGGRTDGADYSCLKVFDRYWMMEGGVPEVVAMWYGHLDQDIFAWVCAQVAKMYDNALLAVEVNSLRKEMGEGEHFLTVLDAIADYYDNLYFREDREKIREGMPVKYGFHTNKATKPMIIDTLNAAMREDGYIERDIGTCDEMDYYEIKANGTYGAIEGQHDDKVIVSAGGVWLAYHMPMPYYIRPAAQKINRGTINEATI